MKKELRRLKDGTWLIFHCWKCRPDEEGIKTSHVRRIRQHGCVGKTDLMKKELRRRQEVQIELLTQLERQT